MTRLSTCTHWKDMMKNWCCVNCMKYRFSQTQTHSGRAKRSTEDSRLNLAVNVEFPTTSVEGVLPLQLRKTGEVRVGGEQLAAMFKGEGCEVCIRHQIADGLTARQHLLKDNPVPFGRLDHSRAGLVQPTLYPGNCLV